MMDTKSKRLARKIIQERHGAPGFQMILLTLDEKQILYLMEEYAKRLRTSDTYITRSKFQSVCEENKRFIKDIRLLTSTDPTDLPNQILLSTQWENKFRSEDRFRKELQTFAKEYLKEHPQFDIFSPQFKKPTKQKHGKHKD